MWIKGKDFDFEKHEGRLVAFTVLSPDIKKERLLVGIVLFDPSGGGCLNGESFVCHEDDVIKIHLLSPIDQTL